MSILKFLPLKAIFKSLFDFLAPKPKGVKRDRLLILGASSILSLGIYFACTDRVAPSRNILRRAYHSLWLGGKYHFQSGSPAGFYFGVGKELSEKSKVTEIVNTDNKSGASDILRKVLEGPYCFGLVQEDYLVKQNLPPGRIQRIAALYEEKLHILYRTSLWKKTCEGVGESPEHPALRGSPDEATRKFFETARVRFRTDPLSGGRLPFQYHLLSLCSLPYKDVPCNMEDALNRIAAKEEEDDHIDVAFVTAGAPLERINEILTREDAPVGLMDIDPALVRTLNEVTGGPYRASTFSGIYGKGFDQVSTLGTDAILIASREVPEPAIGDVLEALDVIRDDRTNEANQSHHPLADYEVTKRIRGEYRESIRDDIETWTVSFIIICVLMVSCTALFGWIVSSWKGVLYTREITRIYRESLPNTSELEHVDGHIPLPRIEGDPKEWIERIVGGISQLLKLGMAIRDDYESGGITVSQQRNIIDTIYSIKVIFQSHLAARIYQAIENGEPIIAADLRRLYGANYVSEATFRELNRLLESRSSTAEGKGDSG